MTRAESGDNLGARDGIRVIQAERAASDGAFRPSEEEEKEDWLEGSEPQAETGAQPHIFSPRGTCAALHQTQSS